MGKKSSKKKQEEEEPEPEVQDQVVDENDDDEDMGEAGGDDEVSEAGDEEGKTKSGRPSKKMSKEEIEKNRKSRRRSVAKRKGYRLRAVKAGYGAASAFGSSRDVAANILSIPETIRACKWAPKLVNKPAYSDIEEFRARTELSAEPLPPGAAAVIRAGGEAFLRKIMDEAVLRSFEAGKPRVTVATLYSVLRPYASVLKFNFAMPQGLVRYAQTKTINARGTDSTAIGFFEGDADAVRNEAKLLPKQEAIAKEVEAKVAARKAKRAKKA